MGTFPIEFDRRYEILDFRLKSFKIYNTPINIYLYESSIVGSYSSTKWWDTSWIVTAVFPTPTDLNRLITTRIQYASNCYKQSI